MCAVKDEVTCEATYHPWPKGVSTSKPRPSIIMLLVSMYVSLPNRMGVSRVYLNQAPELPEVERQL